MQEALVKQMDECNTISLSGREGALEVGQMPASIVLCLGCVGYCLFCSLLIYFMYSFEKGLLNPRLASDLL